MKSSPCFQPGVALAAFALVGLAGLPVGAQTPAPAPASAPPASGTLQHFNVVAHATPYLDTASHQSKFVTVDGLKLNYLDFGGKASSDGVAIVMLPGLNDTAHIFDDLAPRLTGAYPVYALSRRGCGDSDKSASGDYSTDARVADLAGFLDALKIRKVILIGHSLAGDELTAYAGKYPSRVAGLVYLEAAYDRSQGPFAFFAHVSPDQAGQLAASNPASLKSVDAYRTFWTQFASGAWNAGSEANMQDKIVVQPDGTVAEKSPAEVAGKLLIATANAHPDESKVSAPALCLFATFAPAAEMEKEGIPAATAATMDDWQAEAVSEAKNQMHAQVISYPAGTSHYLFIQYPERAAGEILAFLGSAAVMAAAK